MFIPLILGASLVYLVSKEILIRFWIRKQFSPKGKHCYITGGSQGLGRSLAILLAKAGAHVTIVARDVSKLEATIKELEKFRAFKDQKFAFVSCDVSSNDACVQALKVAEQKIGKIPDYVFTCAGLAKPGYMLELPVEEYERQMKINYLGTVYTIREAVRLMVQNQVKGKVVITSSVAAFIGFIGYSPYSPTKAALKAFAESLRSEMILYGIDVHIYFPGTMDSPGLIEENKTKPEVTKIIEGNDSITPDQAAQGLIRGLSRGNFMITTDFIGSVCRATSSCALPWNNAIYDGFLFLISCVIFPIFSKYADFLVRMEGKKNQKKPKIN